MQIKNFEDLEIWKDARHLTREIYKLSMAPKFSKDFALRDQMRRAAVSIMSNIAEGFERGGNQELVNSFILLKGHVVRCVRSSMSLSIKNMSIGRQQTIYSQF